MQSCNAALAEVWPMSWTSVLMVMGSCLKWECAAGALREVGP